MSGNTLSDHVAGAQKNAGLGQERLGPSNWLQNLNIAISAIGPILALVFVSLRIFVRSQSRTFGWDDVLAILAMILSVVLSVGSIFVIKLDFIGIHYYDIPGGRDPTPGLIWIFVVGAVYNPVLAFIKQSVLLCILRIASLDKRVRLTSWLISFVNIAEMIAVFLVVIFQCSPVESFWNLELGQHCINQEVFAVSTALLTILTDIVVLALPFWAFLGLQMSNKKKILLILVFSMGLFVTIVSIVRLYTLCIMFTAPEPDFDYTIAPSIPIIECNLAIITACAPTLWPLTRQWKKRRGTATSDSSSPFKCAQCQYGNQQDAENAWRPSTRHMGHMLHDTPSVPPDMKSSGTGTVLTMRSSRRGLRQMRSFETSNSSTIMSVYQGLRESHIFESMLEPDVRRSRSQGQCDGPDAADPGDYQVGVLMKELERISDQGTEEDIVLVNLYECNVKRIWEETSDGVKSSQF